jgi:hypothetical protein
VESLSEMLEGQVAILSSGMLDSAEEQELLLALQRSRFYRADARSYLLYPDKTLPSFLEKNRVPEELVQRSPWLQAEAERSDGRIVRRDSTGVVRFHAAYRNAVELERALDEITLSGRDSVPTSKDRTEVLAIYEEVFHHRSFTGRSGTFFKYEGLGSIYWHMVSKLNLAVLEAIRAGNRDLVPSYLEIKEGIGVHKSPDTYGAIPVDPYSHTPAFAGAQQPGMTGQVKEDVIARFGELGVGVADGRIEFRPLILTASEFDCESTEFTYLDVTGEWCVIDLPARSVAFTCCQVPVIYHQGRSTGIRVTMNDGSSTEGEQPELSRELSRSLFDRSGQIARIDVDIPPEMLTVV